MDDKEKLENLLRETGMGKTESAFVADSLIAHGVTIREQAYWQLCKDDSSDNRTRHWRCSVCKGYRFHNGEMRKKYKHCPNCGAPMKKVE